MPVQKLKKLTYILLGWLCITLGVVGAFLPILPTTPFLILALWLFDRSSPRFHSMLLNNRWVGGSLRQWQESKTISSKTRGRAIAMILLTFSVSVYLVKHTWQLQIMLIALCILLLVLLTRIRIQEHQ
ncbi:YbaN family protein [Planctobacterium marinum]|uniref:YbaN family protein n=1 Tax=Planctobacterium marinum TaxID=1631968 RepID=UPI001E3D2851|nr:YbaN family protein [Planctobacterium marinum]MCC2608210.1 YbaN family protein [Planctobacterium marinum]